MLLKGVVMLMGAELCFTLATVFAKLVTSGSSIPAVEITFARFVLGLFLALSYIVKSKGSFRPNRWDLVFWRGLFNTVAVILFFMSVENTTVTNANMLNMTYPAFLFLVAPFVNKEKSISLAMLGFLAMTMFGIVLVIHPDFHRIHPGDAYGLLSGIVAAFGVATLRKAREHDSSVIILLYLMGIGTVFNLLVLIPVFQMPHGICGAYLLVSALLGIAGQALITSGYLHISARGGGLVSCSRILFATTLGVLLFHEPLTLRILSGGLLIGGSIVGVTLLMRETTNQSTAKERQ